MGKCRVFFIIDAMGAAGERFTWNHHVDALAAIHGEVGKAAHAGH